SSSLTRRQPWPGAASQYPSLTTGAVLSRCVLQYGDSLVQVLDLTLQGLELTLQSLELTLQGLDLVAELLFEVEHSGDPDSGGDISWHRSQLSSRWGRPPHRPVRRRRGRRAAPRRTGAAAVCRSGSTPSRLRSAAVL